MKRAEKWPVEAVKAERMQDEANRLIREWLDPKRMPTAGEIEKVLEYVRKAPFRSEMTSVKKEIQGQRFLGQILKSREPSIVAHLAKRVLVEGQWAEGTTLEHYLGDLRGVTSSSETRIAVYTRRGNALYLGLLGPNRVPRERLGARPERRIWVVYSPDHGTIVSGYQVSAVDSIGLPEAVRWL